MESLQELRMHRLEMQEQLGRVTLQIERLEAIEYREWQRARAQALTGTAGMKPGTVLRCQPGELFRWAW